MAGKRGRLTFGFEQKLWAAAGKLRGHMDAVEFLGLTFLKFWPNRLEHSWHR